MYKPNIIYVTDFDIRKGKGASGYTNLSTPICSKLSEKYNIMGMGFSYERVQHDYPFGINLVPFRFLPAAFNTLIEHLKVRNIIMAADIPLQSELLKAWKKPDNVNYVGIFAVESDPIAASVGMDLLKMNKRLAISQFGVNELAKLGIDSEHLVVPLDLSIWKQRTEDEYKSAREMMGFGDKDVFFFNADGNERKNISGLFEGFKIALQTNSNMHLVLLTRLNSGANWKIYDLLQYLDISKYVSVLDRGLPSEGVRNLYVTADWYVNLTKAEGLGCGILEAMSVGVPTIVTNATAMAELGDKGRSLLAPYQFVWTDPFLNGHRYFVYPDVIAEYLLKAVDIKRNKHVEYQMMIDKGRAFVESRTIENAANILDKQLVIKDEQT